MNYTLTKAEEKMRPRDLKPGEWQMWCRRCGFKFPKNAAARPDCPNGCKRYSILIGTPAPGDNL